MCTRVNRKLNILYDRRDRPVQTAAGNKDENRTYNIKGLVQREVTGIASGIHRLVLLWH